ncbi:MAG: hypothetical protein L6R41_002991 [Letrouitia leprolyta]|nr:MAG: hypothetical protein L6R41_002991 [Letrouitia leprolyta]
MYQPLPPDHTRYIKFIPGETLAARLETWPIDQAPPYIALSYTWGRAPFREGRPIDAVYTIFVDGRPLEVQENLYDALACLTPKVVNGNRLFWVDAICINQVDIKERSTQILYMKYIYDHATSVCGWIGMPHDQEEVTLAVQLMYKITEALWKELKVSNFNCKIDGINMEENLNIMTSPYSKVISSKEYPFFMGGAKCEKAWAGVRELLSRSYWERTWIYQEATDSAPTLIFCGDEHFDLELVSETFITAQNASSIESTNVDLSFAFNSPAYIIATFRAYKFGSRLLDLLSIIRSTKSTDPRDKVYAFLGLASDLEPGCIVPNYSKSLLEVYSDVVRFSLTQPQNGLQILGHVIHSATEVNGDQPNEQIDDKSLSWLPDYRKDQWPQAFSQILDNGEWAYSVCGPFRTHESRIDGTELIVQGFEFDQVTQISDVWDQLTDDVFTPSVAVSSFVKAMRSWVAPRLGSKYLDTGETVDEALRRTIVADVTLRPKRRGYTAEWDLLTEHTSQLTVEQMRKKEAMDRAVIVTVGVQRLCWTANGRIGLIPAAALVGDSLYTLRGGQTGYIIRRKARDRYGLIGECYIHGLMDGELFQNADTTQIKWQSIILE